MSFILNTKTGMLHTKRCADGETGFEPVAPGTRQHFSKIENALNHKSFKKCHGACLRVE